MELKNDIPWSTHDKVDSKSITIHTEKCPRCGGSGRWHGITRSYGMGGSIPSGACFKCGGTGKLEFKTPADQRLKAREGAAKRKVADAADNWTAFAEAHPAVADFLIRSTFDFARSMVEAAGKCGHLTDGQMAATLRCMARDEERAQERVAATTQRASLAREVDLSTIRQAFDAARASGLKRPRMACGKLRFSRAPDTGRNPGAVYVKRDDDTYLGLVLDGKFKAARDCTPADVEALVAIAADPLAAAVEHGRLTGSCSCCGRELTDPKSVAAGIGPICAENFGW